jgi:fumarylpyruvate hydrolase
MAHYVIDPPRISAVPVSGGGLFPVRRIFCVGRNYAEHSREMGGDPTREEPFFFMKPSDALVTHGADMPYPPGTDDLHHEMELVVALRSGGVDITEADALSHVFGYAAGLDMTRRDVQGVAKKAGRPWDMGKGFDHSAPIGEIMPATTCGHVSSGLIELKVNGVVRQSSDIAKMIWNIPESIAYLSRLVELKAGDLIMTGTPEGVAACVRGDVLEGHVAGVGSVRTQIV